MQYPPREWLSANLHLHTHDVFTPFPNEYLNHYDVVHLRFMTPVLSKKNVPLLMRNLVSLLSMYTCYKSLNC